MADRGPTYEQHDREITQLMRELWRDEARRLQRLPRVELQPLEHVDEPAGLVLQAPADKRDTQRARPRSRGVRRVG